MADNQPGKGRARARGRARSIQPQQPPAEAARGPQVMQPPPIAAVHPVAGPTGGRRNHRGVQRSEVDTLTHAMAATELTGDSAGRGSFRRQDYGLDNTRPAHVQDKTGKSGELITVSSNYFEVLSKPLWAVQQYHLDFSPNVESPKVRRGLLACHRETLGSCYLFDGMSDLKTMTRLENKETELFSQRKTDGEMIKITLKYVTELPPGHPELGRLYNTLMRRNLQHLEFLLLGRHYFDKNAVSEIPNYKLQIWQGVITTIRQQEQKIMMMVDTVHKVVRKDTALDIIQSIISENPRSYQDIVARDLVGSIVMTMYNNRTYRIEDIAWDFNPKSTFESRNGPQTYVEYYMKQYEIKVRQLDQPLLLCTSKEREVRGGQRESKKIYILPELCCMTGLTDGMRSDFRMMKELGNHTKLDPQARVRNLEQFIKRVKSHPTVEAEMAAWQLNFENRIVTFPARVLASQKVIQRQKQGNADQNTADFSRVVRGNHMHVAKNLDDWIIICTKRDQRICSDFISQLHKVCPPMGMQVNDPRVVPIDQGRVSSYIQAFREVSTPKTCIVVFIVPSNKKDLYDALKKNTCIDCPIPSQVIVAKTLMNQKALMSVCTKVGIQMNCKLGGEPWSVHMPMQIPVMIIGYDTYHDSSRKGRSAGAFVASMNRDCTRWYSRCTFHQAGGWQELSDHLKENLNGALRKFQSINRCLPSMILFYRDGVGDGQIRYVKEWEVKQLENTIMELMEEKGTDPKQMKTRYAFIVVNKRINTRFFAKTNGHHQNPPPGTVVDSVVTRHDRYDFYLVSQSARQGTVSPTMFNVIADSSQLKPDQMQILAYKLTHLYFNYQGTIRVPAPCQYAHKLAFLCGQSLHQEPAAILHDKLFYL